MAAAHVLVDQWLATVGLAGGAIVGLGIITRATVGVYRFAKRIDAMHDVALQLASIDLQTMADIVARELQPNGGNSLRDEMQRVDRRVGALEAKYGDQGPRIPPPAPSPAHSPVR